VVSCNLLRNKCGKMCFHHPRLSLSSSHRRINYRTIQIYFGQFVPMRMLYIPSSFKKWRVFAETLGLSMVWCAIVILNSKNSRTKTSQNPLPRRLLNDLWRIRLSCGHMIWLLPSTPVSKLFSFSVFLGYWSSLLTGDEGGGGGGAKSYNREKEWYKTFNTLCSSLRSFLRLLAETHNTGILLRRQRLRISLFVSL
jgi:hypothetical protein